MQVSLSPSSHVLAAAAAGFESYVKSTGGDSEVVLNEIGLRSKDIADPTKAIALSSYCSMLNGAARETRSANFGLKYGRQFSPQMFGLIGFIAMASPDVGSALRNFVELFPHHQNGTETKIGFGSDLVRIEYRILDPDIIDRRQDAEFTLAAFANVMRMCMGPSWSPVQVDFEHPEPEKVADHFHIFDSDITFLQPTNALVMRAEKLDAPMPNGNPQLLEVLRASLAAVACQKKEDDLVSRARAEIRGRLASRSVTLADIADRLRVPTWTLQRRLAEYGLTFSAVVDWVRRDIAALYLDQAHMPLSEIALLLGYSEASAFSRAFRQWTDMSPQSFRKSRIGAARPN